MKKSLLALLASILLTHSTAHAQGMPDGSGGRAVRQDARLLENGEPAEEPPQEYGSVIGARTGVGGIIIPTNTPSVAPLVFLGFDMGYDFSSKAYAGIYAALAYVPAYPADIRVGLDIEIHPLGAVALSPSFGITTGFERLDQNAFFVELPVGLDFRSPGVRTRWGFFVAPCAGVFEESGFSFRRTSGYAARCRR